MTAAPGTERGVRVELAGVRKSYDGHPVLRWNVGNVAAKPDKKENIFPYKPKDKLRIDGAIAGIIALARMMYLEPAPPAPFAFLT